MDFIRTNIQTRLRKINLINKNSSSQKDNSKISPFIVQLPDNIDYSRLSSLFIKYNIRVIPNLNKRLRSIITRGKDKSKTLDQTNLVYKINCKQCPAVYIGETKRALKKRRGEHKRNSNPQAVINVHRQLDHNFDWKNLNIVDFEVNWNKRIISEMINIKTNAHAINKKEDVRNLSNIYQPLFNIM